MDPREAEGLSARMDALTEANVRLLRRVGELEERVARIEGRGEAAAFAPAPEVPPAFAAAPLPEVAPEAERAAPEPSPEPEPAPIAAAAAAVHHPTIEEAETAVGLKWANRAGALTLIIGAAFFFKYAVDNAWIGPTGRILLGLLAGAGLVGWSERLRSQGYSIYSQGVAGAGVTVLYLAFWAAHSLYQLVPAWLAFGALAADTVLAGALALRHGAPALAALGLLGGYLTPPLLSTGEVRPWFYFSFLFAVNLGWLMVARRRRWTWLEYMAFPLTLFFGSIALDRLYDLELARVTTYAVLTQWAVFIWSPARFVPAAAQFVAAVSLGAWRSHGLAGFSASSLPLLGAGLVAAHKFRVEGVAGLAVLGFYGAYWEMNPDGVAGPLLVVIAAFAMLHLWLPARLALGHVARREDYAVPLSNGAFALVAGLWALTPEAMAWRGLFTAGLAGAYLAAGLWIWPRLELNEKDRRTGTALLAGVALTLLTLAVAIQFEGFRMTLVWAAEAAALAWLSTRIESRWLRIGALAVAGIALIRLLGIDAALQDPLRHPRLLFNVRFLTAAGTAAALAASAWWLKPRVWALPPYVAAHVALLTGLAMEVVTWFTRTAAEGEVRSAQLVSLSVLMAVYGVALVAGGVATRTRINRVLGLGLLALVMMKLYLADVWAMARIHRVIAFIALGALLLGASFLYSRFRGKIEALLQDEHA